MSSKIKKSNLVGKLLKKSRVQELKDDIIKSQSCVDIEDTIPEIKSEFFSPIQTRQQRKEQNKPYKIRELTNLKRIKPEHIKDLKIPIKTIPQEPIKPTTSLSINTKPLDDTSWKPKHWQITLDNIRQMRASQQAPVDTMGCNKCQDVEADEKTQRFQILVSLMLSSQTKDEITHATVDRLREHNLTPETICKMKLEVLEKLLYPISFYKTKAKHLKLTSTILFDQYKSDIPHSVAELVKLPGVGPKMAHLCMSEAWNEVTGIGVDVHVHRISNRLQWLPNATKEPEKTRLLLESWLPRTLWREVNHLLVGFGQTICKPINPKCKDCLNQNICPSAYKLSEKPKKKSKSTK